MYVQDSRVISIRVLGSFKKKYSKNCGWVSGIWKKKIRIKEPEVLGSKFKPASSLTFVFFLLGQIRGCGHQNNIFQVRAGGRSLKNLASNGVSWSRIKTETCNSNPPNQVPPAQHLAFFKKIFKFLNFLGLRFFQCSNL